MPDLKRWMMLVMCAATFFVSPAAVAFQQKVKGGLREKDARRAISTMPGVELPTSAVRVKAITTTATSAEVAASVKTAFRFRRSGEGEAARWVVSEVRAAERRWEDLELIRRITHTGAATPPILSDLETLAAELEAQQLARRKKDAREEANDSGDAGEKDAQQDKKDEQRSKKDASEKSETRAGVGAATGTGESAEAATDASAGESRRDAVVVKSFSAMSSSAVVEAEIDAAFRLVKLTGNKWRVVEFRMGEGAWINADALLAALNGEKNARARAEMQTLRDALESFRRERGFYVVAEDHTVLVDHLSPRHLPRIIRIDPWHRPYRYAGTRDAFTLRSDGADGKEGTADDVTLGSAS